jgi:uncharacterized protein GlcG (DUF336 family)
MTHKPILAVLLILAGTFSGHAQLAQKRSLTLEAAKKIAAAAEAEAAKNKWTMVITVLDDGGNIVYLERMDETQIGSINVAVDKAKSAVNFKRPTKTFEDQVAGGRNVILKLPGALPVEGGIPLMIDGKLVGAIGVSGGTSAQDGQVAAVGVAVFAQMAK